MTEEMERLIEASERLCDKLDQVGEDTLGLFAEMALARNRPYTGANYGEELKDLREIIKELK